jgi:hypothetical protein
MQAWHSGHRVCHVNRSSRVLPGRGVRFLDTLQCSCQILICIVIVYIREELILKKYFLKPVDGYNKCMYKHLCMHKNFKLF